MTTTQYIFGDSTRPCLKKNKDYCTVRFKYTNNIPKDGEKSEKETIITDIEKFLVKLCGSKRFYRCIHEGCGTVRFKEIDMLYHVENHPRRKSNVSEHTEHD